MIGYRLFIKAFLKEVENEVNQHVGVGHKMIYVSLSTGDIQVFIIAKVFTIAQCCINNVIRILYIFMSQYRENGSI